MNISFFPANVTGSYLEAEVHPSGIEQFDAFTSTVLGISMMSLRCSALT